MLRPRWGVASFVFVTIWLAADPAAAFTMRVHIVLANDVRASLMASGDGTIQLRWSDHSVQIPMADADAIVDHPLAFRAGAIGPDNIVFPAMTDGTHGVEQDPYRQCELLYEEAFTSAERAYALGCFLHGTTDAIAHHFVNYYTGETFTLTPLSSDRESSFDNVIGHIATESIIQSAFYGSRPSAFSAAELDHRIEQDLVLRTYFNRDSPVWQRMTEHQMDRWAAAMAANPPRTDGPWPRTDLVGWITAADYGPWEHIAMAPVYIDEIQRVRTDLRAYMVDRIAALAVHPDIEAEPGADGVVGTPDDVTACSASCPQIYAEYWVLVHLLAPRQSAGGDPLPPAFDKLSTDLGANLYGFLPALMQVIENLSTNVLNTAVTDDGDHGLDIDRAALTSLFAPIDDWAAVTFAIDWETAGRAVSPTWYTDVSDFLAMFGVSITIPDIIGALFQPIVDQIRNALINEVRDRAEVYVDQLKAEYDANFEPWRDAVNDGVGSSEPIGLGGDIFENIDDSGLVAHAFNITAATLANHEVLLVSDPIADGPASFDTSYTPEWSQLGLCGYLREAVFPHGLGLVPLLSVERDGTYYEASLLDNSPIECHAGALSSFGAPGPVSCAHTDLGALLTNPYGSLSRGYPPNYATGEPACARLIVPGLPEPPPIPTDGGVVGDDDAGGGEGGLDGGAAADGGADEVDGGCGCRAVGSGGDGRAWLAVGLLGLLVVRRRLGRSRS